MRSGMLTLALVLGAAAAMAGTAAPAVAKPAKAAAKSKGAAPPAEELNKLKAIRLGDPKAGTFTWGMSPNDVLDRAKMGIELKYKDRIEGSGADPGKQQRIRDQRDKEIAEVKRNFTKFEGQKTGWDVSIIGSEFSQNNGEAVIQVKEDIWTRYFFFFEDRLYKMFLAFNKDVIGTKSFRDFGKDMAAKYGTPREVYRDEKHRGSVKRSLDHFEWAVSGGDALKLVDRSEFYGVYCLVLSEAGTEVRVAEKRKITNPQTEEKDALVEAALNSKESSSDGNDNIVDRITGHNVKKPGEEEKHGDVIVPMPKAPSPSDVNASSGSEKGSKKGGKKDKEEVKGSNSGLEL